MKSRLKQEMRVAMAKDIHRKVVAAHDVLKMLQKDKNTHELIDCTLLFKDLVYRLHIVLEDEKRIQREKL